jgi:hypothetical protein
MVQETSETAGYWKHILSLFFASVALIQKPTFASFHSLLPVLLRLFWWAALLSGCFFSINRPLRAARIIVIWAFGSHTATGQSRCHNWILCESQTSRRACLVQSYSCEPVSKWHYNAFCSRIQPCRLSWTLAEYECRRLSKTKTVFRGITHSRDLFLLVYTSTVHQLVKFCSNE